MAPWERVGGRRTRRRSVYKGDTKACSQAQLRAKGFLCGRMADAFPLAASRSLLKALQGSFTVPPSWTNPQGAILMGSVCPPQPMPGDTALTSLGTIFSGFGS